MSRLHVFPTEAALGVTLDRLLRDREEPGVPRAVELGRGLTSIPRLIDQAADGAVPLGDLAETLLLRELAPRAKMTVPSALGLRRAIAALRRAGIAPSVLRAVADKLLGPARDDARWLAAALHHYEELLGARVDTAGRTRAALLRIATAPIAALSEITDVELHDASPNDPLERALIEALAARGLSVRCRVPDAPQHASPRRVSYDDALEAAIGAQLEGLEAITAPGVERGRTSLEHGPIPHLVTAPTPRLEARELARLVRDRVAGGTPADEIAVVVEDSAARARTVDALRAYEVPVEERTSGRAVDSGAARVLLSVYALLDEELPRDELADFISSRYLDGGVPGGRIHAGRVARALHEAVPIPCRPDELRAHLLAWVATQGASRRPDAEAIPRHVLRIVESLRALPLRATLSRHVAELAKVVTGLGLFARARGLRGDVSLPAEGDARALARDQAALRAVSELLEGLPRAAMRTGLAERIYTRSEVAEIIAAELGASRLSPGGARGAAVLVCELARLPPARRALVAWGAVEARVLPAVVEEDALVPDALRHVLNRALDRLVFSLSRHEEQRGRLRLARARAAASAVLITCSTAGADGRPLDPGELVEHARAMGATESRPRIAVVPSTGDARTAAELTARLLIEAHGDVAARQHLSAADLSTLRAELDARDPARLARIDRLSSIERSRAAFFQGAREPGEHDGRIDGSVLTERMLPGRLERPLSASTIARYVECPHRFFLESVLRVRTPEELADELDERDGGALAHLALERLFVRWRDAGLFPLSGRAEEETQIAPALQEALVAWGARRPHGNELVFRGRVRTLGRLLQRIWQLEVADPPAAGLRPTYFELAFDRLEVPGGPPGSAPVYLRGAIDRVDVAGDHVAVFDYKSGRLKDLKRELKEESWGVSSWQLPIYAAVARSRLGARDVDMAYYSLKELVVERARAGAALSLSSEADAASGPLLSQQIWEQVEGMRQGRYDVAPQPRACETCRMQPICRIVERREDDAAEEGA